MKPPRHSSPMALFVPEEALLYGELTFLSHFAFAFAQWTQAIGIRSVGESISAGEAQEA